MAKLKHWLSIILVISIVLVVDLITKHFLFSVDYYNLIPNVLSVMSNGGNDGAAWGIFSGERVLLISLTIVMITALFVFNAFVKKKNLFYCISFGFIIGGALGNLYDRIRFSFVRDFIFLDFFPSFPIFNMADSFLCIGAVMLAIFILFMSGEKSDKTN